MQASFLSKQSSLRLAIAISLLYINEINARFTCPSQAVMPYTDFKPETLSTWIRRMWRENRGNWLLAIGGLVSVLGCLVGYFDLIPEIEAVDRTNVGSTLIGGSTLTVDVVGCSSDQGKVIAMLYDGRGFNDSSLPLRLELLDIHQGAARWEIHNISYGSYAVYAFQDLDGDEKVDPTKERQGLSILHDPPQGSTVFTFSAASFDFSPQQKKIQVELHGT